MEELNSKSKEDANWLEELRKEYANQGRNLDEEVAKDFEDIEKDEKQREELCDRYPLDEFPSSLVLQVVWIVQEYLPAVSAEALCAISAQKSVLWPFMPLQREQSLALLLQLFSKYFWIETYQWNRENKWFYPKFGKKQFPEGNSHISDVTFKVTPGSCPGVEVVATYTVKNS